MGSGTNVQSVASVLLRNREFNESRVLTVKQTTHLDYTFTGMRYIKCCLLKLHGYIFLQTLLKFLLLVGFSEPLVLKIISSDLN